MRRTVRDVYGSAITVTDRKNKIVITARPKVGCDEDFVFTRGKARRLSAEIMKEADPAFAARLASIEAVERQRDNLLAAAKVGLHAVNGLIGMLATAGEKDETLDTAKYLIEAAIAACKSPAGNATGP